jgi:methylated-DNA-[protein]-cysteine S-methyltransferase
MNTGHAIKYMAIIPSPIGKIGIVIKDNQLSALRFLSDATPLQPAISTASQEVALALSSYFTYRNCTFNLNFSLDGSEFQKAVWHTLKSIPFNKTITYGELAQQFQTSPRAIGQACRTNPIPIIIPCHRVIAAKHLGGYAGKRDGKLMEIKKWLLLHEKMCH